MRSESSLAGPARLLRTSTHRRSNPKARPALLLVVLWMSGTLLSFSAMAIAIRALGGAFSVLEILTMRAFVSLTSSAS